MTALSWTSRLVSRGQAPIRLASVREFFAYHGVWAVGVRLLRRLSIRTKIGVVLAIVLAPLIPMTAHVVHEQNLQVVESTHRLAGVRLATRIAWLAVTLNDQLLAVEASQTPDNPASVAALERLVESYAVARSHDLAVQQAWERGRVAIEAAVQSTATSTEARAELILAALTALAELHSAAAESAAVPVTKDSRLHHISVLAMRQLPALQSDLSRLRRQVRVALSHEVLAVPSPRTARANLVQQAALASNAGLRARDAMASLRELDRGNLSAAEPLPEVAKYLEQVNHQMLALDLPADAAALHAAYLVARNEVRALRSTLVAEVDQTLTEHKEGAERLRFWVFVGLTTTLLLALYLLYSFFLVMGGGLRQLNQQMGRMAQGDLSARLAPLGEDEIAKTMTAMTVSLTRLSDLVAAMRQGVGSVAQASEQVANGNAELTSRNRATASGLESMVEGVTRYGAQLEACGRQVEVVVHTVQALRLESVRNRKQMQRLRERMNALRGKSREIGEIVTLIDMIAFRTNILALNASVEASKAGEAGRGFAVVAQEVRSLALRGAESARRIGDIVARSTDDIEVSGALADETGRAMAETDQHVDHISGAMDDVAALTRTGERESAEILTELTRIKDSTAQNLRLVEQLATASGALRSQGERLAHKVGQFKLS